MKHRSVSAWFAIACLTVAGSAVAHAAGHEAVARSHSTMAGGKSVTLKGELVDTGCYASHDGKGAKHQACAAKCIANGMPMGLLTADGTVYLVTLDHDNLDPYNQLKGLASQMVAITGPVATRGGMKTIQASEVKSLAGVSAK